MHYTLTALTSLLLLTLSSTVTAADCSGDKGTHPNHDAIYLLRESMCGPPNLCSEQSGNTCTLTLPVADGVGIIMTRTRTGNSKFPNCWDATENIIKQCFAAGGNYQASEKKTAGSWKTSGEEYKIEIKEDGQFLWGGAAAKRTVAVEGVDDDPSTPGGDYVWGPRKFCVGLGPGSGGNDACIDIKENCYVVSPIDNKVPRKQTCVLP